MAYGYTSRKGRNRQGNIKLKSEKHSFINTMSANTSFLTGSVRKEYTLKPLCPFPNSFTEKSNENSEIKVALIIKCVSFLPIILSRNLLISSLREISNPAKTPIIIKYIKVVEIMADLFSFIFRINLLNDSLYNLIIKCRFIL